MMDDDPTMVTMDAAAMTFPDGSFDCVFSHSCFEHLSELGEVIRQVGHDVRIFSGRRESIPPWAHPRPQYRHLVQSDSLVADWVKPSVAADGELLSTASWLA
jgi:hypothetical protein